MLPLPERGERIDGFQWPGGVRGPAPATLEVDDEFCRSAGSVLVAGDHAVGPLAGRYKGPCLALARLADCSLLEIRFIESSAGLVVSAVDAMPPLVESWESDAVVGLLAGWGLASRRQMK